MDTVENSMVAHDLAVSLEHKVTVFITMITKYWETQKLPQIYTANHATFPIRIRKITVPICSNFWVTQ